MGIEASKLILKLKNYGADIPGIKARFSDNAELYEKCFYGLFSDPVLSDLGRAISNKEYGNAFEAAHALKGVTGNLGLTPLYQTVCILVESLRAKSYSNIDLEYEAIVRELKRVEDIAKNPQKNLQKKVQKKKKTG